MRGRAPDAPVETAANEAALASLLDYIERQRDRRRREILDAAEQQAAELVRSALRQGAERVRETIAQERRDSRARLQAARAAKERHLRQRQHEITRRRLDAAWSCLEQQMQQRWKDAGARADWIAMALAEAAIHLPAGTWRLEHPEDVDPEADGRTLEHAREQRPDVDIECVPRAELDAGVRVRIAQAVLDATPQALLRRRSRIEGLLLGRLGPASGAPARAATHGDESQ